MIKDSEAFNKLVPEILALAKNEQRQNELKSNIGNLGIINADEIIANEILKHISK